MNYSLIFAVVLSLFYKQGGTSALPNEEGDPSTAIVGGEDAIPGEFPWLVNMKISNGQGGSALCGGSLIALNLVLTAAHCVLGAVASRIEVTAGDHNYKTSDESEQVATGEAVRWHEKYDSDTFANDIALIRLENNFTETNFVKTINLPSSIFNGSLSENGTVAGWGTTKFQGSISEVLQKVTVKIVNDPVCSQQQTTDRRLQFCAGEVGKDSCQGDSGGPFICEGAPETVCGIVSFGNRCAEHPGVYTHVPSYVKWINDNRNFSSATTNYFSFMLIIVTISSLVYTNF